MYLHREEGNLQKYSVDSDCKDKSDLYETADQ